MSATRKQVSRTPTQSFSSPVDCCSCQKPIRERYLLKALDQYWHEDCLKCSCCEVRLGEVGSTLFSKANLILCKRDYLRLFGNTGFCSACNKTIPGFEMVMRAKSNVYHLECFSCFQCRQKFCVGDRFYLHENKILCEYDYEERMVFANLSLNNMEQVRRQTKEVSATTNTINTNNHANNTTVNDQFCDVSSGYGSSDSPFEH
ncbi:hypothetical protein RDWZM_006791 [Blomia tropicalis]|uniref:LIM zinc-binding domain-containing protein n=1 Tax=Blomia tropicalis TaxID=40697 RepID=A0A9Q0M8S6_BLOTA|nr:Protein with similarity to mammalian ELMO [Blomia tropicalis]KAJ6220979.1 hypothetical protein RDWZM_006791 [Blomia tropicalis]